MQAKNPAMAASLAGEKNIRPWLGPAGLAEKKSGHGSGWLAEFTNCHGLIFISAKNPAAGNFAMDRMPSGLLAGRLAGWQAVMQAAGLCL